MSKHWTYFFTPPGGSGYSQVPGGEHVTPGVFGTQQEVTALYDNGVFHNAFGDISGSTFVDASGAAGDTISSSDPDILAMESGSIHTILIWDEQTTSSPPNPYDLYGGAGRYGLPGGGTDQTTAIDVIQVAQPVSAGDHSHDLDANLVNLSHNAANGGQAYTTDVTFIGGPGRDLFIGGEGNDVAYGGDEHSGLGDGIWGGGGSDTLYGGANLGNTALPGADDLFGYSGNDVLYGANDGDVYYGDAGNDMIYGAGFNGIGTIGSGYNGDQVTFFGGDGNDTLYASANVGSNGITSTKEFFFGGNPNALWNDNKFVQKANGLDADASGLAGIGHETMDVVSYQNAATAITVNLNGSFAYTADTNGEAIPNGTLMGTGAGGAVNDLFYGIEGIIGGTTGDTLIGDASANFFSGLAGSDTLFGNAGNDTLWGGDAADTLYGGLGADSIDGGNNADLFYVRGDATPGGNTTGWDGTSTTASVAVGSRYQTLDSISGGAGVDSLFLDDSANNPGVGAYYSAYSGGVLQLSGVEIITATALADIVNLTNGSNAAVADSVSIFAGDGADVVFSGSGNDLLVGDANSGSVASDTLFGGAGRDIIFGDLQDPLTTFGVADTLFGGDGNDTIFGGAGNDRISDIDTTGHNVDTSIDGGDGGDFITADFANNAAVGIINGGNNSGADLADKILVTGSYNHIVSSLGLGNDTYIGGGFEGTAGTGTGVDTVSGGLGSDAIAGWRGNDVLYGDNIANSDPTDGGDALWGGAGADTIYGGPGSDYIYPGAGGNDVMYGGIGIDNYYISRTDGTANQIWDEARIANTGTAENYLVVLPAPDQSEIGGDNLLNGSGVFEADHDITNVGMVQIVNRGGDLWTLSVNSLADGSGTATMTVNFDDRDINQIVLWNNDATGGTPVLQIYQWDSVNHTYVFLS